MPKKSSKSTIKDSAQSYLQKIEADLKSSQSRLSLVLGALIVLVVGILIFNFINKNRSTANLGPAQQTQQNKEDVTPDKLPGKYTVKEGDTLFEIADKYYKDGYQYPQIAQANNLSNPDSINTGEVLEIPKPENSPSPAPSESPSASSELSPLPSGGQNPADNPVLNEFGSPITSNSYTVQAGDWLSTIAARAYGDVMAFDKIAKANNIQDPNLIEPGTVLTIPR